ncbi:MAG: sigma-54-dependent Fis family transcriptional regulator [Deltaproteobacteria bacterium]|nr:sigma-54-dependent Fis family transcriptional regulator [Deltaproteobacteria bacterium]
MTIPSSAPSRPDDESVAPTRSEDPDDGDEGGIGAFRRKHAQELRGEHPALLEALDIIRRVADTDATVLVTGESGTGKELVARAIHRASARSGRPFVAINCGAVPEGLLESELFGHAKGAFTGAHTARVGRFAQADGGSVFLDEIGEIGAALQVKLLRVLQERDVTPVGDARTYPVDIRVIAATNRDLEAMSAPGGPFRSDLYYRLNVIQLVMPPLRERATDIPLLLAHFVEERNRRHNRRVSGVTPEAMSLLCAYGWPGNVRELQNVVERIVVLKGQGSIEVRDLPERIRSAPPNARSTVPPSSAPLMLLPEDGIDLRDVLDQLEHHLIRQALERAGGNKNRAAALLRLQRTTLVEKLKRRGLAQAGED